MKETRIFDIKGRSCIITGAGGAICGTLAQALGSEGAEIAVLDINKENAEAIAHNIDLAGGKALPYVCNVLDRENLLSVNESIIKEIGSPDFLINGAGGNNPGGSTDHEYYDTAPDSISFNDLSYEGMLKTFQLNYFGTVLPIQVFSKGMLERKKGSIINFASASSMTPLTKVVSYSSAKAAIANLTKWLAVHYSPYNVRVNALAPGFIMTEQLKFLHIDSNGNYTERAKKVVEHTPFKRYGEAEELVGAVLWLLSDAASFTTGSVIPVDGGFTSYSI